MRMRHKDKVAVITGASQGIGWGIANKLGIEGAKVMIGDRNKITEKFPFDAHYEYLDVTDESSVKLFFEVVQRRFKKLDILVNNAGIMFEKHFLETSLADWDRMMAVNLRGVFVCSKYAAELMMKGGGGAIVNIGSIEGNACNPDHAPYAASKSGVHGLTRAIAVDLGPYNIRCNVVLPGWIVTALNESYFQTLKNRQKAEQAMIALHPAGRLGNPADVANMVSWLASDESAWITGHEFIVDGGRLVRPSIADFENIK
jgi:meso-butanediol dehydrogenase/(S,S)-butanediol dehydrogenase/diacetyl reductase